jgi:hypothetical protein
MTEKKVVRTTVYLKREQHDQAKRVLAQRDTTLSAWIRRCIEKLLQSKTRE